MTEDVAHIARRAQAMLADGQYGLLASREAADAFLKATIGDDSKGARRQRFNDYLHNAARSGQPSAVVIFDIRTAIMRALRAYADSGEMSGDMRAYAEMYIGYRAEFEDRQSGFQRIPVDARQAEERAALMS